MWSPVPEPPADAVELFARERAELLDFLARLGPDDWQRPTVCPGWTVLGLATHLVGDDFSLIARHRDDYAGTLPPAGVDDGGFVAWLDELQDDWVRAARRLSPRLTQELLSWTLPELLATMARHDPRDLSADVSWAGPEAAPVWLDQLREVSEYWIHRQQLRWALGQPTDLDPGVLAPLLEAFKWAYPYRLAGVGSLGDTVTIGVTGDVTAGWMLRRTEEGWRFVDRPGSHIVASMLLEAEAGWRLLTNNLPPDAQAALDVRGEPDVVDVLLRTRAIIGAPN